MSDRVEQLIEKLKNADRGVVRSSLIEELGQTGDHRAIRVLIGALNDNDVLVRWNAIQGLAGFSEDAIGFLLRALDTPDKFLRRNIIQALGEIRSPDVVGKLIKMLMFDETDAGALVEIVKALNKIGDERAVEPLITVLEVDNWEMKWRAIHALGRLGDSRAVEPLLKMVDDRDNDIKWAAVMTIERIKNRLEKGTETSTASPLVPSALESGEPLSAYAGQKDREPVHLGRDDREKHVTVRVRGELASGTVEEFSNFVEKVISDTEKPVALDLSECSFLDSFALSKLNIIRKKLKGRNRPFFITGMRPGTRKIFEITKLDTLFDIR